MAGKPDVNRQTPVCKFLASFFGKRSHPNHRRHHRAAPKARDPVIQLLAKRMDARVKPGHDAARAAVKHQKP